MRCGHYTGDARCLAEATHWLLDPRGRRDPSGWMCAVHGCALVREYRAVLGQRWRLQRIDQDGNPLKIQRRRKRHKYK